MFRSYSRPEDSGATTNAPGSIGLPEARELAFSPVAWLDEPFRHRNLGLAGAAGAKGDEGKSV